MLAATFATLLLWIVCGAHAISAEDAPKPNVAPTHRYDFETDIGTDSVGGSSLTSHGATVKTNGDNGYAYLGGDGAYMELPSVLVSTDAVTFMMDITPESNADFQKILTLALDFDKYFQIALRRGSDTTANVEVQLTKTGSGEVAVWGYTANNVFTLDNTYSLAITIDAGDVRIYVDGVLKHGRKCPYTIGELLAENPTHFYIGKSLWDGDPYFVGGIDNFEVYDSALSYDEIAAINGKTAPTVDIDGGVVKYYSFDDETDACKNDVTLESDLVNNGGTFTADGKFDAAMSLSENAYLKLGNDVIPTDADAFSFAAWIYPTSGEDWQKVIDLGSGMSHYLQLALRTGDNGKMHIQAGLITGGEEFHVWGSLAINSVTLDAWNHVALSVDGNYARIYVDGKIVQSGYFGKTIAEFMSAENPLNNSHIGRSQFSDPTFKGKIDEAVFYSRALSIPDAEYLAAGHTPQKYVPEAADTESDLTHYYSYDNADFPGLDNTGSGGDATALLSTEPGKANDGAVFDGGYVHLPQNVIPDTNAMTFATWIYPESNADFQKVMELGKDTVAFMHVMLRTGSSGKMHIETALTVDGDTGPTSTHLWGGNGFDAINLDTWQHVALTVEDKQVRLYVDGALVISGAFKRSLSELYAVENGQIANYIGKSHFGADPDFAGMMDETLFYSRALSSTDINSLAKGGLPHKTVTEKPTVDPSDVDVFSDLESYYPFDGVVAGIDHSGNKKNAIISHAGIATTADGVSEELGSALEFDGKRDFIILPTNIVPKTGKAFTFAAWVRFDAMDEYTRIFDFGESMRYFDLRLRNGGVLETTLTENSTAGESRVTTASGVIKRGVWQHVALTVDGMSVMIYVDGALVGTGNFAKELSALYDGAGALKQNYIGLSRYGQDSKFLGGMDEIRIYYRALTAVDVAYLAQGNKATVENADLDETVEINGVRPKIDYITAYADGVENSCGNIVAEDMTVGKLIESLTLISGATATVTDNYDFDVGTDARLEDGFYLKIMCGGAVVERLRIGIDTYFRVVFDTDGGDEKLPVAVKKGDFIELPYVYKNGYDFIGWYDGDKKCGDGFAVTKDCTLKAVYEQRKYTLTFDMRDGTYNSIKAYAGDTVSITGFGNENVTGYKYAGETIAIGDFVMPAESFIVRAIYRLDEADNFTYTEFGGAFDNVDGRIVSGDNKSLLLFDGIEVESGTIEMKITPNSANDCGIIFWADDGGRSNFWEHTPAQYHVALLNWEGYLLIGKINHNGKTWECVADCKLPNYDPTNEYTITVVIEDNNVKVYLDGTLYIDYTDKDKHNGAAVGVRSEREGVCFEIVLIGMEVKNNGMGYTPRNKK